MLKIKGLYKTFNPGTVNEKKALDGLNLEIKEGDFVTVIGGNGAGKSTMLHRQYHNHDNLANLELTLDYEDDLKNWNGEKVKVRDAQWGDVFILDMNERECTCGLLQDLGFPCGHALYILHTLEKYDEVMSYVRERYKQQHILETIGELKSKEMWEKNGMDVVVNLNSQGKDRVRAKIESYRTMGIQYWEKASTLAQRIDSTGERERNTFLGLTSTKRFKSSRLAEIQTTLKENRRKW